MLLNELKNLDIYLLFFPESAQSQPEIPGYRFENMSVLKPVFLTQPKTPSLFKVACQFVFRQKPQLQHVTLFPSVNRQNVSIVQKLIADLKPDIIWAEHLESLLLISQLKYVPSKVVYSHHDFTWKLILIRRKKFKDFVRSFLYYLTQKTAIRQYGSFVVGGASNELQEIKTINPACATLYLPTLYPVLPASKNFNQGPLLRIVHLGSSKATANHIGIKNLLNVILPRLQNKIEFECHMIGAVDGSDKNMSYLLRQDNVVYEGFVQELASVLRAGDIHILPYDKATGSRTRYSVAMNHGQVLVAHQAAVEGIEGLVHNENCIIENSLEGIADAIIRLYKNPDERMRLGGNAKKWYDETHQLTPNARLLKDWLSKNNICHG